MVNPGWKVELMTVEGQIFQYYQTLHRENPSSRPDPTEGQLGRLWKMFDALMKEAEDA